MVINSSNKLVRLLTGMLMVGILLVSAFTVTGKAHAMRSVCRTDPIVTFSDGSMAQFVADIQADASSVDHVAYELHVPTYIKATSIQYAESDPVPETVNVISDQLSGLYGGTANVVMKSGAPKTKFTIEITFNNVVKASLNGDTSKPAQLGFTLPTPNLKK